MLDLVGKKYGRLTPTNTLSDRFEDHRSRRLCHCDCGKDTWVFTQTVTSGRTKSCGCLLEETRKLDHGKASRNEVLRSYQLRSKRKGLLWDLTEDQFESLVQGVCHYCNREPSNIKNSGRHNGLYRYNGIDRLDNNIGYTLENSVTCCFVCNRAKGDMSLLDFMDWIRNLKTCL